MLARMIAVAVAVIACTQVHAWTAIALDRTTGHTFAEYDDNSIKQANAGALQGCKDNGGAQCVLLGKPMRGTVVAIANGDDGTNVSTSPEPAKAAANALQGCKKSFKNCKVTGMYWDSGTSFIAVAMGADSIAYVYDGISSDDVAKDAIARCEKRSNAHVKCKIGVSGNGKPLLFGTHGWLAVAYAPDYTSVAFSTDKDKASSDAVDGCREGATRKDDCKLGESQENTGPLAEPGDFQRVKAIAMAGPSTRQRNETSCTNDCVNGSCVRTFPDGRKERWQAPRVMDPFTNDWKWDINSCGG